MVVVKHLCEQNGIDMDSPIPKTRHLYAIGSILLGYQNATIWGSGFGYNQLQKPYFPLDCVLHRLRHRVDIRAVRGPLTRQILLKMGYACPEVYGDPAILMPLIYQPQPPERKPYIVVPHYSTLPRYEGQPNILGTYRQDFRVFLDRLCAADLVISASLHGIILAETYGIPAVMLADTPSSDITKYKDWYLSTGRETFPIASSLEEALQITPSLPAPGVLERMREDLIRTFPRDLWDN